MLAMIDNVVFDSELHAVTTETGHPLNHPQTAFLT